MNKNESKYFNTAVKMDKAFLALIEKKDFAYITVKEICEKAGVNRSGNVVVKNDEIVVRFPKRGGNN